MPDSKRIGLFGGTFDPVHLGHTIVAEWMLYKCRLDEIFFVPNFIHPFAKRDDISPPDDRLAMLKLAIHGFPYFSISDYELKKDKVSYTIDTIRYFKGQFPDAEIYYLIGSDNVREFSLWKDADKIFQLANVAVHNRSSQKFKNAEKFNFIDSPLIEISSSFIRKNIKNHLPYRSFLHPDVSAYIEKKKLFGLL
ncbi:MAG: nicotinate (nicotinamide) nucleotide adenylyltransferase [Calditrichaceae bacterium]